jgi:hypothetical protein
MNLEKTPTSAQASLIDLAGNYILIINNHNYDETLEQTLRLRTTANLKITKQNL